MSDLSVASYFPFGRVFPVSQVIDEDGLGVRSIITFDSDATVRHRCWECEEPVDRIHSYHIRRLRDLNLAHAAVELDVPQRKLRCPRCGIRAETHDFFDPFRRCTWRLESAVADLCRVLPIKQVAAHYGLSWHTVKEIDKRQLIKEVGTPCYDDLRLLAVDEISVHKGHRYMTTVLDLETGRLVWMGHGRTKATLLGFFDELSVEQLGSIEAVAIDIVNTYRQAIEEACPQAALVYDPFHVIAHYGRTVVDRVRLDESKKENEEGRRYIKGSRYLLLKNEENLSDDQRSRLQELLDANEALSTVYVLKDQLKQLFRYERPERARRSLHLWCELAEASGLLPLQRFAAMLLRSEEGLVNHARYPIHTGRLEGMHNRIKVIKRQAYGFRDDAYFILKAKAAFPGHLQPD